MLRANLYLMRIIAILLIICSFSLAWADTKYGGGTGEPNDPYQIWDANHMQAIGADPNDWDKHFILMADIDLGQFDGKDGREKFNVIALDVNDLEWGFQGIPFTGLFDGNNKTISNFTYWSSSIDYIGLWGCVRSARIKNIGLIDPNIDAGTGSGVGSLAGCVYEGGTLTDCYAKGGSVVGNSAVGGLVGSNRSNTTITKCYVERVSVSGVGGVGGLIGEGNVSKCYATGNVRGEDFVGGLIGVGNVSQCYATGNVEGVDEVGGLVGMGLGTITNSYATGNVYGNWRVGGVAGHCGCNGMTRCYATGQVSGNSLVGGLYGQRYCIVGTIPPIQDCYWDIETSGELHRCGADTRGSCGSYYGKTTAQMHQQATFEGWDFINVWNIGQNQTYPYLRTVPAGDINKDETVNFLDLCIIAQHWCNEQ